MTSDASYWDPSALVKTLVRENGSDLAEAVYSDAGRARFTSDLTYVEVVSAVARRLRNRELEQDQAAATIALLDRRWPSLSRLSVSRSVIRSGATLSLRYPLSGADAIHLATALDLGESLTFVTWDRRQAAAADALGFEVLPALD